jgi:hypothetical protein
MGRFGDSPYYKIYILSNDLSWYNPKMLAIDINNNQKCSFFFRSAAHSAARKKKPIYYYRKTFKKRKLYV